MPSSRSARPASAEPEVVRSGFLIRCHRRCNVAARAPAPEPRRHGLDGRAIVTRTSPDTFTSPCTGLCTLDRETGICDGCYRHIDEIVAWATLGAEARREVMRLTEERRLAAEGEMP